MNKIKTILNLLLALSIIVLSFSCGGQYAPKKEDESLTEYEKQPDQPNQTDFSEEEKHWIEKFKQDNAPEEFFFITGYISPFEVIVDEEAYSDSEEFYTSHFNKLEAEKATSGYSDYRLELNADIGITDLKKGMSISIVPTADQGYTAEDIVDWEGKFSTKFPNDADGDSFTIRAIKKIDVTLTKGNETIKWCYNLIASRKVEAKADSKPYIIKNFTTKVTKYKCTRSSEVLNNLGFKQKKAIVEATEEFFEELKEEPKEPGPDELDEPEQPDQIDFSEEEKYWIENFWKSSNNQEGGT